MKVFKIALYIRVSSEEQAENPEGSIKNQEHRLRDYVEMRNRDGAWGEIVEVFCDAGISAKNMNRPSFQKMLSLVKSQEINLVLVTEISRLTRSIKDFTILWEYLKDCHCKFQSLRDNFDTTTPSGEMVLFTLANFAHFERRQLGERISNAFQARAKRGLWNGGALPLGYDINPEKPGHLMVVEKEADIVREVFKTFLVEETLSKTGKSLNDRGIVLPKAPRKGGSVRHAHFTISALHRMLTNRAYIGRRVFKTKEGVQEVAAVWPPLIEEVHFVRIQEILSKNQGVRKPASTKRYPYILTGLVICKSCGDRMCGKSAHGNGGKIGYYEHSLSTKVQSCLSKKVLACNPQRVLAKKIEPAVWDDVKKLLCEDVYAESLFAEAKKLSDAFSQSTEIEKIKAKISSVKMQIEATTERISELPKDVNADVFYQQIAKLQAVQKQHEEHLVALRSDGVLSDQAFQFSDFKKFRESLRLMVSENIDPEVQSSICRKLIQKIEVSPSGIRIHYHAGQNHYGSLIKTDKNGLNLEKIGSHQGSEGTKVLSGPFFISKPLRKYRDLSRKQAVIGSNNLRIGRECRARTSRERVKMQSILTWLVR